MGLLQSIDMNDVPSTPSSANREFDESQLWCFTLKYEEEDVPCIILNENGPVTIDAVELYEKGSPTIRAAVLASDGRDCPFTNLFEETRDKRFRPKKFYVFSVLDLRGFERKSGEKVAFSKKALLVKEHMMTKGFRKQLSRVREKQDTLRGSLWEVSRSANSQPSPAGCGDLWQFSEMADLSRYTDEDTALLTEDQILSLFVHDPEELKRLASEWDTRDHSDAGDEPSY